MRPAFSSTRQAAAFGLLLLLLFAAPWLAGKKLLPPREQAYAAQGWEWGPLPWDKKQIFEETNDIDIAFLGSSRINWGIDTPYVRQKLDERLGHPSVVLSICWGGSGFDTLYVTAKDLLEHRRVKTIVFYDESAITSPAKGAEYWFRYGDNAAMLKNLPFADQAYYYFAAMVGMPRNLLELLTPNLPEATNNPVPNYYVEHYSAPNPEERLGAVLARQGIRDLGHKDHEPFVPGHPRTGLTPADARVYSPATAGDFRFADHPLPAWQVHFARLFAAEARQHHCQLVLVDIPVSQNHTATNINESANWPAVLQSEVALLGIPPGRLFAGLSYAEVRQLYADNLHFNQNGAEYFTALVTPALLQLHENRPAD